MKDWTGNKHSTYSTLGASNHSEYEREEHDYYATDPAAIDALFSKHNFADTIWEPACGEGHLSKRMEELEKVVRSTDLIDRGYGQGGVDFLKERSTWQGDIITNPPYAYAKEFAIHGMNILEEGGQMAMFLKLTFLEGQGRIEFFRQHPPKWVYVFSYRIQAALNGAPTMFTKSSAACYAWFVWRKGFKGLPTIDWITKNEAQKLL